MKIRLRTLILLISSFALAIYSIHFLFTNITDEQDKIDINIQSILPFDPKTLINLKNSDLINNPNHRTMLDSLFKNEIPNLYYQLFSINPVSEITFALFPQGCVCFSKVSPLKAKRLGREIQKTLNTFPPQIIQKGNTDIYYYPDAFNQFVGCFFYKGLWVSSYNKQLLDRILNSLYRYNKGQRKLATNKTISPVSIQIPSSKIELNITQNDSCLWKYNREWMDVDIITSQEKLSFIFNLSFDKADNDSLSIRITDSLCTRFSNYLNLPVKNIKSKYQTDKKNLFISLDYSF